LYNPILHNAPEVVAALAAGDPQAVEKFYRSRWLAVFHFIRRYVTEQAAAEDIATDTFLKCWERRGDFNSLVRVDVFLFLTAKNVCLNWLRDTRRHSARERELYAELENAEQPDLEEQEVAVRVYQYIYEEIGRLPEKMQQVLRLHLEGIKNEEIASRLGIAEKTVRNLKTEAIRLLRLRFSNVEFAILQFIISYHLISVAPGI
jgi:RNA polymerase sigma factor (sigma-70 family)